MTTDALIRNRWERSLGLFARLRPGEGLAVLYFMSYGFLVMDDVGSEYQREGDQEEAVENGQSLTEVDFFHQTRVNRVDDDKAEVGQGVDDEHRNANFAFVRGSIVLAEFYCWSVSHKM